jgi:hypothetical protein
MNIPSGLYKKGGNGKRKGPVSQSGETAMVFRSYEIFPGVVNGPVESNSLDLPIPIGLLAAYHHSRRRMKVAWSFTDTNGCNVNRDAKNLGE